MSDPPDFEDLARRYLDLWQEQWSTMAADPESAQAMSRIYGMMGQQMAAAAPMAQAFLSALPAILEPFASVGQAVHSPGESHDATERAASGIADRPAGAAPAGGASGSGAVDVAELAGRVAALEERIARLEARRPARRAAAKPKSGKD